MRKRFLLEGEYQDQSVWIAVEFIVENVSVMLHLFLTSEVKKENLQNWVKDTAKLPKALISIQRTIEDQNLLTEEIKVVNVGRVRDIEIEWADNLLQTRMLQGFDGELLLLKDKIANLEDYSQVVFDECSGFWERLINFKKDNSGVSNQKIDQYKADLDILFEALKELRKDHKKEISAKSIELKADFELKLEILSKKLEEKPSYKFIIERLKEIRLDLNKSGLRQKNYAEIDEKINAIFDKMNEKREVVSNEKVDKRISDLEAILAKMQKSADWDAKELAREKKNLANSQHAFQAKLIETKITMVSNQLAEKNEKLANIKQTLDSLAKKSK